MKKMISIKAARKYWRGRGKAGPSKATSTHSSTRKISGKK